MDGCIWTARGLHTPRSGRPDPISGSGVRPPVGAQRVSSSGRRRAARTPPVPLALVRRVPCASAAATAVAASAVAATAVAASAAR